MGTKCRRDERGQTLVEFALIIPIVILLLVGVFDLGRVVFINNSLSDGARHGARNAATDPRATDYCAEIEQAVRTAIRGQALSFATVSYQVTGQAGADNGPPHLLCQLNAAGTLVNGPGAATLPSTTRPGSDRVTVTLRASVDLALPFVAVATGRQTFDLEAVSTMVVTFAP